MQNFQTDVKSQLHTTAWNKHSQEVQKELENSTKLNKYKIGNKINKVCSKTVRNFSLTRKKAKDRGKMAMPTRNDATN